jgi:DNA-binding transcriptional ArsR family regulator
MKSQERGDHRVVHLDRKQIRTLAHPLRVRLLGALRADGPATATKLAQVLGTNTGATSYHLRQLADAGLVVEEPDRATGRQRWWRAAHDSSSWRSGDFDDDPDASAASDWVQGYGLRFMTEEADHWLAARRSYPDAWRDAADFSDFLLELAPQRLRALNDELHAVVERYRQAPPPSDGDTEQVLVLLAGFPRIADARAADARAAGARAAKRGDRMTERTGETA